MRRNLPPLESLWAFHTVAETGSLTAAAAALSVTQPAVSKRMRDLEQHLGCALVRRGVNAISLTPQGARYATALRKGFAQLEAATQALRAQSEPLRVRAYTTWSLRWLIPRLPRFRELHPDIDLELTTSTADVDLARERVDAAVKTAPIAAPPMPGARRLQPILIAPFAAPTLAAALDGHGLAGRLLGSRVRPADWQTWRRHRRLSALLPTPLLFESTSLAIQAALEGLGTVICSPAFVREDVRAGRLVALSPAVAPTGDGYWLILPQGRLGRALRSFADWLEREANASEGS